MFSLLFKIDNTCKLRFEGYTSVSVKCRPLITLSPSYWVLFSRSNHCYLHVYLYTLINTHASRHIFFFMQWQQYLYTLFCCIFFSPLILSITEVGKLHPTSKIYSISWWKRVTYLFTAVLLIFAFMLQQRSWILLLQGPDNLKRLKYYLALYRKFCTVARRTFTTHT